MPPLLLEVLPWIVFKMDLEPLTWSYFIHLSLYPFNMSIKYQVKHSIQIVVQRLNVDILYAWQKNGSNCKAFDPPNPRYAALLFQTTTTTLLPPFCSSKLRFLGDSRTAPTLRRSQPSPQVQAGDLLLDLCAAPGGI